MAKITIIKTDICAPENMTSVSEFLFKTINGFTRDDRTAWRRFWKRLAGMQPGEMANIEAVIPRNPKYHRKFFALLNVGFDAWEPPRKRQKYKGMPVQKNFEQFREDVTIAAGFYEQTFDLQGRMRLKATSISFAKMDDVEFERVYSAVATVLLQSVLSSYAGRDELDSVVNQIMGFL